MKKTRYAFAVLAVLTLLVGAASIGFTVSVEHKFCSVVTTFTSVPVSRPADPASNPSREKQFELFEKFVALAESLGC